MFLSAKPIWIKNTETEPNCRVQFKTVCHDVKSARVHIATSGIYQLWINGKFVSYGPARAGKNHFRMDDFDITSYLNKDINVIIIEVAGYYCKSFYVQEQPSFLQAEIVSGEVCIAATGRDFSARKNPFYYQKIQRYSFQRTFAESYDYSETDLFFVDETKGDAQITVTDEKMIIERKAPYPEYGSVVASPILSGTIEKTEPESYHFDRYCDDSQIGECLNTGWKESELEFFPEKEYQKMVFSPGGKGSDFIKQNEYAVFKLPYNATGIIDLEICCDTPVTVYLSGDEIMTDQIINPTRERVCNIICWKLGAGVHKLHTFEVYTMQYVQLACLDGDCKVLNLSLTEYKHPSVKRLSFNDEEIQTIADAAVETFCQNAVDVFTDCPSRERAGWLCDSYFLAKAEKTLTGKNIIEESFLENFLHEDEYKGLPKGMLPMCYPSDILGGQFIPNWAMWFVVELGDYYKRTGNRLFTDRFKTKVYNLLSYFKKYENSDGLLENLDGWIFVEWSRANDEDMVSGVNYPSNMMYYTVLNVVSKLYDDHSLSEKAEHIKDFIAKNSFNGKFFIDHAQRQGDKLIPVPESTEVCQYYALFCGIADPKEYPEFFQMMIEQFGPNRDVKTVWPEIYPAAPFIGNYLRLEILMRYGYKEKVVSDIKDYFLYMAKTTGTLWEKAVPTNSCNHGFASCVLTWLEECV